MKYLIAFSTLLILLLSFSYRVEAQTLGPNLVPNPGFENSTSSPTGWLKGGYGTNTRTLTFPVTGNGGGQAARVAITSYTSGDAKWYPNYISVTPGKKYQFSDVYESTVPSNVYIQFKLNDGTFSYQNILSLPVVSNWTQTSASFTVPANTVSLSIFHLIRSVGTLDTDNYSLNEIIPAPNNLIPNGDFEMGATGTPTSWSPGHWGSNIATFTYPVSGVNGGRAVQVSLSNYSTGDAKWFFAPLNLPGGIYTYSDSYLSSVSSTVTVQLQNADGSFSYKDIADLPASNSWVTTSARFYVPTGTQNVTVFHLINQNGTLAMDNASLVQSGNVSGIFTTGAVTLTFDDGWLSQYQNAYPKLKADGVPASFYIISHQLSDFGFPGYMSEAQVEDLFNNGEEIGDHTQTHPHLSQLSASDQQTQILGAQTDLNNLGVGPVITFAYPFGDYNATTLQILHNSTIQAARSSIGGFVDPTSDPYQLPRQAVVVNTTFPQLQNWINQATSSKTWLVLELHEVSDNGDQFSISPALFDELVDYLKSQNVQVVTLKQGLSSLAN